MPRFDELWRFRERGAASLREPVRTGHYILRRESRQYQRRLQRDPQLGDERCVEPEHYARIILIDRRERVHQREPNGNHDLYADSEQCCRIRDRRGRRHRAGRGQLRFPDHHHHCLSGRHAGHRVRRLYA